MKVIFLIFLFFLLGYGALGQHALYPRNDTSFILGAKVRLKALNADAQESGFRIYRDVRLSELLAPMGPPSNYWYLIDKEFAISQITSDATDPNIMVLHLRNPITGILYYRYNPFTDADWIFSYVSLPKIPTDLFCRKLVMESDSSQNTRTVSSPMVEGLSLVKVEKNKRATIYLSVRIESGMLNLGKLGLILVLANGRKLALPGLQVNSKPPSPTSIYGSEHFYTGLVPLDNEIVQFLLKSPITHAKLHVYENTHVYENNYTEGFILAEYLKCILKN